MGTVNLRWSFALIPLLLASCETSPAPQTRSGESSAARQAAAPQEESRPGLGTAWGETRGSHIVRTNFRRANAARPFAVASLYYNDLPGIIAMAGSVSPRQTQPIISAPAGDLVSVGLRDQGGRFLPGLVVGERWFVVGEAGRRYTIAVRNKSELRLEVVLSVDGLDVMDGRPASFRKRGYIVAPHGRVDVEGFRQNTEQLAAFRFGSVRDSYANQKYRETRNVGVVGIALFNEYGTTPFDNREVGRRLKANPFPNGFATPP